MGTLVKGLLKSKWQSQLQFVRYKNKVNITRPRPPHYERALLEKVCLPIFSQKKLPKHVPNYEACTTTDVKWKKEEEGHPLEIILVKEIKSLFENSKLIIFFHSSYLNDEEKFQYTLLLKKNNMKLYFLAKVILQKAFKNTAYEPILKLYEGPTATVFSKEDDFQKLLKNLKKMPKFNLMGALMKNTLLGVTQIKALGKYENITEVRLELLSVLNSASQNLVLKLNHNPTTFVELLNQRKKLLKDSDSNS